MFSSLINKDSMKFLFLMSSFISNFFHETFHALSPLPACLLFTAQLPKHIRHAMRLSHGILNFVVRLMDKLRKLVERLKESNFKKLKYFFCLSSKVKKTFLMRFLLRMSQGLRLLESELFHPQIALSGIRKGALVFAFSKLC